MIDAKDVERTFRTWLDLARDEEVLVLFALVQAALVGRGYTARCEWVKLAQTDPASSLGRGEFCGPRPDGRAGPIRRVRGSIGPGSA